MSTKKYDIYECFDKLCAHSQGATDSSELSEEEEDFIKNYLAQLNEVQLREFCAKYARRYILSDEAIARGYGIDDVRVLVEYMNIFLSIRGV